jgi:hypothetical protein
MGRVYRRSAKTSSGSPSIQRSPTARSQPSWHAGCGKTSLDKLLALQTIEPLGERPIAVDHARNFRRG